MGTTGIYGGGGLNLGGGDGYIVSNKDRLYSSKGSLSVTRVVGQTEVEATFLSSSRINCSVREIIVLYSVFCLVSLAVKFSLKLSVSSSSSEVLVVSVGDTSSGDVFSDSRPSKGVSGRISSVGVKAGIK